MAREIGLSKLYAFEVDDINLGTYQPLPTRIEYVVNIEVSKTVAEYSVFGDNVAEISSSQEIGAEITLEVSSNLPPQIEAKLTGKTYQNGALVSKSDDTKKLFGLAWETVLSDGTVRRYFYNACTISKNEQSNETISDSVTAQTYTLVAKAIPLPTTKETMMMMDEKE